MPKAFEYRAKRELKQALKDEEAPARSRKAPARKANKPAEISEKVVLASAEAAGLQTYQDKRDFGATPEPLGQAAPGGDALRFVVQKHDATRLHYDLRLELDGVLKSWAVTRGPSLVPGEKRLAVHTEDHPMQYLDFEGVIPKGQYGGGTMIVWDQGSWTPEHDAQKGLAKGHLDFALEGERLKGRWHLVRMRPRPREKKEQWLLLKSDDSFARAPGEPEITDEETTSLLSGRTNDELAAGGEVREDHAARQAVVRERATAAPNAKIAGAKKGILPAFVEPSLATLAERAPNGADWLHEIKFDGYRIQARIEGDKVRLLTRKGLDWTDKFGSVAEALKALKLGSALIDGELVVEDEAGISDFPGLQIALKAGRSDRMCFYAFDLLYLEGSNLTGARLDARKALLQGAIAAAPEGGRVRYSEHIDEDGQAMALHACRMGLEGIISKRRDQPYRSGRGPGWLKTKCTSRQEFVIVGYVHSTLTSKAIGSLVLGVNEGGKLVHVGRVGTGFTAALARDLWREIDPLRLPKPPFAAKLSADAIRGARWVEPKLVTEVEFRGWTSDNLLRQASFKGLREDKDPREVVREAPATPTPAPAAKLRASEVKLTHPDRVFWEDVGLTKQGLAEFYQEIADWVLPHVADRPLSLVRCPSGAGKDCFFQKHAWAGMGKVVEQRSVGDDTVLFIKNLDGLTALVQAGVLEIHPWGSRMKTVEQPDRITFDLDPDEGVGWEALIDAAREVRDRLQGLGLESLVKNTGGKGLHVVVPLTPKVDWEAVKGFAQGVAEAMTRDSPDRYTATLAKRARTGRIFIDYLRNGRGATAVAAYSTRARAGAPVSTPLGWDELSPAIKPNHFTVANLPTRLAHLGADPWAEIDRIKQVLPAPSSRGRGRKK